MQVCSHASRKKKRWIGHPPLWDPDSKIHAASAMVAVAVVMEDEAAEEEAAREVAEHRVEPKRQ